jgi:hypothetical protein
MARSTFRAMGATALAGLFLAACSSTVSVSADDLAQSIREDLARDFGVTVDEAPDVTCPGPITGEIGATMTCTYTGFDDEEYGIKATVTSVEGLTVNFEFARAD